MITIQDSIEALGGIAAMRELVRFGHDREVILMSAEARRIIRVRQGWYAVPGNHWAVEAAWRAGGALACVSALAYLGFMDHPEELHIAVRGNADRRRDASGAVTHWCRADPGGDRRAVSIGAAVRQAARCAHVRRDSL
ncbi:MAG: hypothetical protein V4479_02535 [Actinomycetota bacterium]